MSIAFRIHSIRSACIAEIYVQTEAVPIACRLRDNALPSDSTSPWHIAMPLGMDGDAPSAKGHNS